MGLNFSCWQSWRLRRLCTLRCNQVAAAALCSLTKLTTLLSRPLLRPFHLLAASLWTRLLRLSLLIHSTRLRLRFGFNSARVFGRLRSPLSSGGINGLPEWDPSPRFFRPWEGFRQVTGTSSWVMVAKPIALLSGTWAFSAPA